MYFVMVALANWLQKLFSTNLISTWKHFPVSMEYGGDSHPLSLYHYPYACRRASVHEEDDTHHVAPLLTGYTALPF